LSLHSQVSEKVRMGSKERALRAHLRCLWSGWILFSILRSCKKNNQEIFKGGSYHLMFKIEWMLCIALRKSGKRCLRNRSLSMWMETKREISNWANIIKNYKISTKKMWIRFHVSIKMLFIITQMQILSMEMPFWKTIYKKSQKIFIFKMMKIKQKMHNRSNFLTNKFKVKEISLQN